MKSLVMIHIGAFTLLADTIMTKKLEKRKDVDVTRMFAQVLGVHK